MTRENLEEIKKLAEAATPGPWATEGETWEEVDWEDDYYQPMPRPYTLTGPSDKTIWSSGGGEYAYPDDATAAFIVAMREHALPLVKALREAWARDEQHIKVLEQYRLEVEDCKRRMGDLLDQLAREEADAHQFQKERDQYQAWMLSANDELTKVRKVLSEANELRVELTKERNEARAEIERLRKLLNPSPKPDLGATLMRLMREGQRKEIYSRAWQGAILEGNTREQAHCIAADAVKAALKEEG